MLWPWMLKNPLLIEVWTHDSNCQDSALELSCLGSGRTDAYRSTLPLNVVP